MRRRKKKIKLPEPLGTSQCLTRSAFHPSGPVLLVSNLGMGRLALWSLVSLDFWNSQIQSAPGLVHATVNALRLYIHIFDLIHMPYQLKLCSIRLDFMVTACDNSSLPCEHSKSAQPRHFFLRQQVAPLNWTPQISPRLPILSSPFLESKETI